MGVNGDRFLDSLAQKNTPPEGTVKQTEPSGGVFFSYYPYYNYEKNYSKMIEISDIESGNLSL